MDGKRKDLLDSTRISFLDVSVASTRFLFLLTVLIGSMKGIFDIGSAILLFSLFIETFRCLGLTAEAG